MAVPMRFEDDEAGYFAWLRGNPAGYVLNTSRSGAPSTPRVLHLATCRSISGAHSNYTTRDYIKVCSLGRQELIDWAAAGPREADGCGLCLG